MNGQDDTEIFKVLLAAVELLLQELIDYLQKYMIENKSEWMEQHFAVLANDKVISKFSRSFSHKSYDSIVICHKVI